MNGVDYQPQTASPNKKHAKAMAATVALQALGEVILKIVRKLSGFSNVEEIKVYFTLFYLYCLCFDMPHVARSV